MNDSLLHLATRKRNGDLIKAFIEAGCSIDRVNAEGQTCLHIAALNGDEMALRLVDCTSNASNVEKTHDSSVPTSLLISSNVTLTFTCL